MYALRRKIMKSIIDEFYDFENSFVGWIDRGENYKKMRVEMSDLFSKLIPDLTEEQRGILEDIKFLHHRIECEAEKASYKEGFKTGLALAAESLLNPHQPLSEI